MMDARAYWQRTRRAGSDFIMTYGVWIGAIYKTVRLTVDAKWATESASYRELDDMAIELARKEMGIA